MSTEENPFDPRVDNPGVDEIDEHFDSRDTSSRRGSADTTDRHRTYEETIFGGNISDTTPLLEPEESVENSEAIIRRKFPNFNPAKSAFTFSLGDYDQVMVKLKRLGGKKQPLFKADGEIMTSYQKQSRNLLVLVLKKWLKPMQKKLQDVTKK